MSTNRVILGCCWFSDPRYVERTYRLNYAPPYRSYSIGFRLMLESSDEYVGRGRTWSRVTTRRSVVWSSDVSEYLGFRLMLEGA